MIAGIVLAAGRSSRMGSAKALVPIDGEPALARLVRIFRAAGLDPIVVVGSTDLAALVEPTLLVEGCPDGEMIDSLVRAIERLSAAVRAAVVQPVDAPFTTVEAVRALCAECSRPRALAFEGRRGHPVLVPRALFEAVRVRPPGGLRTLLQDADLVPWDRSVLADLDTPADLMRWQTGRPLDNTAGRT